MSRAPARIANLRDKLESLSNAGVDRVIVEHFNEHFASMSPQDFTEHVLVEGLHVKWLMVGEDFCYGAKRAGNVALLAEAGRRHGFDVHSLPAVLHEATRISSSAVRTALAAGDFAATGALLGHPYSMSGHVIHGAKLGRNLGFPTLNLRVAHRPALAGIFVVQVHGLAAGPLPAVASLGVRPTVEDAGRMLLEVHVFDCRPVLLRQAGARGIPAQAARRGKIRRPCRPSPPPSPTMPARPAPGSPGEPALLPPPTEFDARRPACTHRSRASAPFETAVHSRKHHVRYQARPKRQQESPRANTRST